MFSKRLTGLATLLVLSILVGSLALVWANGNETLGTPSITIEEGSGYVADGTGLFTQPSAININVPGTSVVQALLYWGDRFNTKEGTNPLGDDTITVNGSSVTGEEIGFAPPIGGHDVGCATTGTGTIAGVAYRADVTDLISLGGNVLTISDFDTDCSGRDDGAALVVIYNDGSTAEIDIRDGADVAYTLSTVPAAQVTVPQTYIFNAESADRQATLTLLVSDVQWGDLGDGGGERFRTSSIQVTVDGANATTNLVHLGSNTSIVYATSTFPW
ncbi:MAG: DUF3344 domain-containing protein [Chloroflexi bacterium]|nr:DUF3344 domain-containing protein [Chloroflexota bacterium]MDA1219739.1 DUF3344 domain-containing protein [Chloroflexota bacterium]PKB57175.1 MAG: hypothetical protein BZY73_04295 [SAR202 cluster bacterium Casp-Chloro-G3]